MAINPTIALRAKRLRRHSAVKLVWLWIAPDLTDDTPATVKVGATAGALGLKRATVRRALRVLVGFRYLRCTKPATVSTAGEYVLGTRALQLPSSTPVRPLRAPAAPLEELPLFRKAS